MTAGLKALSQRHGATLYMTLLAGWAAVAGAASREQKDVVIGTPAANRGRAEIEKLIGFFVNTLALRVELSGRRGRRVAGAGEGADAGGAAEPGHTFRAGRGIDAAGRSLAHSAVFQVMFTWQNTPQENLELAGLVWKGVKWGEEQRRG